MKSGRVDEETPRQAMTYNSDRPVCDYEGSAYRTEFWGEGRAYEDAVERVALRHMLPPTGKRLLDVGGGYGRLIPHYDGYDDVVIFDYARSQLRQARRLWGACGAGGRPQYAYVAGDFYGLPFAPGAFDTVVMVRTLHHAVDAASALSEISRILAPEGSFILEFANKRNLKAIFRYLARRQDWSPFDRDPVEFVPLNFDFHPTWVQERLNQEGLRIRKRRAVSMFRLNLLKRILPTRLLVTLDRLLQSPGGLLPLSPSVFVRCEAQAGTPVASDRALFRCTACGSTDLRRLSGALTCTSCHTQHPIQDGIYDFKAPHPAGRDPSEPCSRDADDLQAEEDPNVCRSAGSAVRGSRLQ